MVRHEFSSLPETYIHEENIGGESLTKSKTITF